MTFLNMQTSFNPWFPITAWGSSAPDYPTVTLRRTSSSHCIEKIDAKIWRVSHLSFDDLIALQNADIKYAFKRSDNNVFIHFDTDADEAQAIMLLGS